MLKRYLQRIYFNYIEYKYLKTIFALKKKKKIRVAFFVVFFRVFPGITVYNKMLKDPDFLPCIVVIPDISRENELGVLRNEFNLLRKNFPYVECSYNWDLRKYEDVSDKYDLVFFSNPYDYMTNHLYSVKYFAQKGILTAYISYGYMLDYYAITHIISSKNFSLFWKVFVDTKDNLSDMHKYMINKGRNTELTGYSKMDIINSVNKNNSVKKKIIIAPHHTIDNSINKLFVSNFLKYSDFYLELAFKYSDIDFIFLPHPLLLSKLRKYWSLNKLEDYLKEIQKIPNFIYYEDRNYFEIFVNSNGIIHDCISFLAEYLFTGHPICYLMKNDQTDRIFTSLGKKCLNCCYLAFNEHDIYNFIEEVIIADKDLLQNKRKKCFDETFKLDYPHTSEKIVNILKKEII